MPMRTRSHVLEEESRQAFKNKLPPEWVSRPQVPDYGLDEQVQIFKDGESSKYFFFVQIKGSDGIPNTQDAPTFSFKTKRLLQYLENPLPVLLVLYDSVGKRLFYEWIHSFFRDCPRDIMLKLELQKTLALKFTKRLDNTDISVIERDVRHHYYWLGHFKYEIPEDFAISISVNLDVAISTQIIDQVKKWIRSNQVTQFIKVDNITIPDGTIIVNSEPPSIIFSAGGTSTSIDIQKDEKDGLFIERVVSTLKILIAVVVANCGLGDVSLDIIRRVVIEEKSISPEAEIFLTLPTLAKIYAERDRVAEAMAVSEQLLKSGYVNIATNLASSALHSASTPDYYYQQYRRYLKTAIDYVEKNVTKAALHYSLANNLHRNSYFKEAIFHYNQATKHFPMYRNKSYLWAELGGCLFLLNRYIWAERCYQKAIELGEKNIPVIALLADTYLHEGKFQIAKNEFENYFRTTKKPFAEFILKHWLSNLLVTMFGDVKRNQRLAMKLSEEAFEEKSPQKFFKALRIDPLCGYAWFNHALGKSQEAQSGRYKEWLATSILQNWDIEAWTNTIISLISSAETPLNEIVPPVFFYAFKLHGENLKEEIKKMLIPQLSPEEIDNFISRVSELAQIVEHLFPKDDIITIRYFSGEPQSSDEDNN